MYSLILFNLYDDFDQACETHAYKIFIHATIIVTRSSLNAVSDRARWRWLLLIGWTQTKELEISYQTCVFQWWEESLLCGCFLNRAISSLVGNRITLLAMKKWHFPPNTKTVNSRTRNTLRHGGNIDKTLDLLNLIKWQYEVKRYSH